MNNFKRSFIRTAIITGLAVGSMSAQAADWKIVQDFTGTTSPVLSQGATTLVTDSVQALNSIRLNLTTPDNLTGGSAQNVTLGGAASIGLTQGGAANARATQALNNIVAGDVGTGLGAATQVTQTVTSPTATTLSQTSVGGADNVQAISNVDASGTIAGLTQTYTPGTTLTLNQVSTTAARDQQALNRAELTGAGKAVSGILQTATGATGVTTFSQTAAANAMIQSGNLIDLGTGNSITGAAGVDQQVFTGGAASTILNQEADNAVQSLNAIVYLTTAVASVAEQQLTLNGTTTTFTQNDSNNSTQAGNYVGIKQP